MSLDINQMHLVFSLALVQSLTVVTVALLLWLYSFFVWRDFWLHVGRE